MAKIALITENLDPLSLQLAQALLQQKQDVTLVTSQSEKKNSQESIRTLFPFHNWSLYEATRALPKLISENYDVWHFLFHTQNQHPRRAHWMLASVARAFPYKVIAGSFADNQNFKYFYGEKFLSLLDLTLFSNRSLMMQMKRRQAFAENSLVEILPPLDFIHHTQSQLDPTLTSKKEAREEVLRLLKHLRPFLVFPEVPEFKPWMNYSPYDFVVLKKPDAHSIKKYKGLPLFYTGLLQPIELELFLQKARALCLLDGEYSVLELQRFHQWSEQYQLPVIARKKQTETYPGLCWQNRSGWIFSDHEDGLQKLFVTNPQLKLAETFANYPHRELVDSTLNELVRLYQKSYVKRWTSAHSV